MTRGQRITVRLGEEDWVTVQSRCQEAGLDISDVVRAALRATAASKEGNEGTPKPPKSFSVPDRILRGVPKYLAWGSGNPKEEWHKQFDEFFALNLACKKLLPKTPGIAETLVYLADIEQRFPRDKVSV